MEGNVAGGRLNRLRSGSAVTGMEVPVKAFLIDWVVFVRANAEYMFAAAAKATAEIGRVLADWGRCRVGARFKLRGVWTGTI
jgi:hypothetical protein